MAEKKYRKPLDDATLDMLEQYVKSVDPLKGIKTKLPVSTQDNSSTRLLLREMGKVQTNRAILDMLDAAEEAQRATPGLVGAMLDPKKGPLFAPARFGSALLADLFGIKGRGDTAVKLQRYNPIEAAVKSFAGDFSITGGDVLPVKKNDNFLERSGKLVGAFAWDVLTDPTSYIGGPASLARKGVVETAATQGAMRVVLNEIETKALAEGLGKQYVDDVVEKLATQNRRFQFGKIVRKQLEVDATTGEVAGPLRWVDTETGAAITDSELRDLASQTMSEQVSEQLMQFGPTGVYDFVRNTLISAANPDATTKFAKNVFESVLPRELAGGLYLINPITGKRYVKLTKGGLYDSNFKRIANSARFKVAQGTRPLAREFGGEAGPIWAQALEDLHPEQRALKGSSATTFGDYLKYKEEMRKRYKEADELALNARSAVITHERYRQTLDDETRKIYDDSLPDLVIAASKYTDEDRALIVAADEAGMTSAERAAHVAKVHALMIHQEFRALADELVARGILVELQDGFWPLFFSKEGLEYLRKYEARQGLDLREFYSGELSRETFEKPMDVNKLLLALGESEEAIKQFDTPAKANERARELLTRVGRKAESYEVDVVRDGKTVTETRYRVTPGKLERVSLFEENPSILLSRYANWAVNRIATHDTVANLKKFGVLIEQGPEWVKTVNATNAAAFVAGSRSVSAAVRGRLQELIDEDERAMKQLSSEDAITAENTRRKAAVVAARKNLSAIEAEESALRLEISEAASVIRRNDLLSDRYVAQLRRELTVGTAPLARDIDKYTRDIRAVRRILDRQDETLAAARRKLAALKAQKTKYENVLAGPKTKTVTDATGKKRRVKITMPSEEKIDDVTKRLNKVDAAISDLESDLVMTAAELEYLTGLRDIVKEQLSGYQAVNVEQVISARFEPLVAALDGIVANQQKLADVVQRKKVLRKELKFAELDSTRLRVKEVNKRTNVYLAASKELEDYRAGLRGTPRADWSAEQLKQYELLRDKRRAALKNLKKSLGWVANSKRNRVTAGRQYAQELVKLVTKIGADQARLASVFADPHRLTEFTDKLLDASLSHDARMEAFGALMTAYKGVRSYVTKADMDNLTELQRRVLNPGAGVKETVIEHVGGPVTAKYSKLEADLRAASLRNDSAEVKRLEGELLRLEAFAERKYFALLGANKNVRLPRAYDNVYGPLGVRTVIERVHAVRNDPNEWEQIVRNVYDPLAFVWKTMATVGRGFGYIVNNLIGGSVNNYIGDVTAADHWQAARLLRTLSDVTDEVKKRLGPTATPKQLGDEVEKEARKRMKQMSARYGEDFEEIFVNFSHSPAWWSTETTVTLQQIADGGLVENADKLLSGDEFRGINFKHRQKDEIGPVETRFRNSVDWYLTLPVQRWFSDKAQTSEVFLRLAAYIRGVKKFKNYESALNFTYALHFDYRDLSDAEQWVKRLVPFYTWNRYNIPLQLRTMFFQPNKIKNLVRIDENLREYFGADADESWMEEVMPEWFTQQSSWVSRIGFAGRPIALTPRIPIYDLDKSFKVVKIQGIPVMMAPKREAVGALLGPAVTPLEWIGNVNFDTGQPYKNDTEKLTRLLTNLVPLAGTIRRGVNAATVIPNALGYDVPLIDESKNVSDAINLFLGSPYGAMTVTEGTLRFGLMQTAERQAALIEELALKADVDVQWLRQMIQRGLTPRQIEALIKAGYGKGSLLARERALRTELREPSRDYSQVLEGFIKGSPTMTGFSPQ